MGAEPVVVTPSEREWETWADEQVAERGAVWWKTLISGDRTHSAGLTLGVARVPPGAELRRHRHDQPEVYLILEGAGVVVGAASSRDVGPGDGVFLPGDALHALRCTGERELRLAYVLAADSFADVTYRFEP
jgi:mannose-6-phosphate isomerase-like protein (cupin superfamily)